MQVLLDNGYVSSYAIIGEINGGIEVSRPKDLQHFEQYSNAYFLNDKGELELDKKKLLSAEEEQINNDLRTQRRRECFNYINRGKLWYDTLTKEQLEELMKWYNDWLNVTEGEKVIPAKPKWLN